MGVEYSAALVVGVLGSELSKAELKDYVCTSEQLGSFAPYFDAPLEECVIGVEVLRTGEYDYEEVCVDSLDDKIEKAKEEFGYVCEIEPSVYLTPVSR